MKNKILRLVLFFSILFLGGVSSMQSVYAIKDDAVSDAEAADLCKHECADMGNGNFLCVLAGQEFESYAACKTCIKDNNVWTELGCINPTQEGITAWVMMVVVGVVTGGAVFRFIQAGLMLNTEDKEKKKEAFGIAGSALAALVMVGLVTVYLNLINISILEVLKGILGI